MIFMFGFLIVGIEPITFSKHVICQNIMDVPFIPYAIDFGQIKSDVKTNKL